MSNGEDSSYIAHDIDSIDEIRVIGDALTSLYPDVYIYSACVRPFTGAFKGAKSLLLSMVTSGSFNSKWKINEKYINLVANPGEILVIPPHTPFEVDVSSQAEFVNVYISQKILRNIYFDFSFPRSNEFIINYNILIVDKLLESIISDLANIIEKGAPFPKVENEYLVRALVARVISRYSTLPLPNESVNAGLALNTLQSILDYIDENLHRRIDVDRMALTAGMGPAQFARVFKRAMNVTLHQYVISRRVNRAREMLVKTDFPIAEIAQECGFADQMHLTRFFGRFVGLSPASYRKKFRN
ncbi:helix-turn-helix domain-containing protein [Brucellaceae bacterium D45D]